MGLNPLGRNWGPIVNWDDLGKLYAALIVSWTVILGAGMIWLIRNRRLPSIRIRNIALTIAATGFLHVYLVKIFLAYTTNGHFLCSAEFWIMSIYLPFGIALFQANMVQLQSISEQQQQLLAREPNLDVGDIALSYKKNPTLWQRWCNATSAQRTYVFITFGMIIQV